MTGNDTAAFCDSINNTQMSVFLSGSRALSVVRNAGEATVWSVEVEFIGQATDKLQISANVGYLNPDDDKFEIPNPGGGKIDVKIERDFPYSPRTTINLGADCTLVPAPWGTLIGHVDYSYTDDYVPYVRPDQHTTLQIDAYGLLNGRLTLSKIRSATISRWSWRCGART